MLTLDINCLAINKTDILKIIYTKLIRGCHCGRAGKATACNSTVSLKNPAASLLIPLCANVHEEAAEDVPRVQAPAPMWETPSFSLAQP